MNTVEFETMFDESRRSKRAKRSKPHDEVMRDNALAIAQACRRVVRRHNAAIRRLNFKF
jgi:hypothetical protein